ncbi:putative quinol monooxygenase [Dyadobacter flavalbus]|nr:putative quinol monooxygenase [Dyadobacter flavalbus]
MEDLTSMGTTRRSRPFRKHLLFAFLSFSCILVFGCQSAIAQQSKMMIRIAEIEIDPASLEEYKAILKEEAAASIKLERGVISIFPMYSDENPTSVRILEVYADRAAYEQHLKTTHFQRYKTGTASMVKSLKLVDMTAIDPGTMPLLFKKLKE